MAFGLSDIKKIFEGTKNADAGVVGVDIGSSSIKVVQLKLKNKSAVLETYGELQLGPYGNLDIGQTTTLEMERLTEALVDIIREASVTSKQAANAISFASSFVTVITLPGVAKEKLVSMVPIEARKYVPVPINEVTLDWFVIPAKKDKNNHRVLLAAIHNEALSKYKKVLGGALLASRFSEIEIFSTIRSSVHQDDRNVAILDLGASSSKLYVVRDGIVVRSHSITSGAQDLTQAVADTKNISFSEAEEIKRLEGLTDTGSGVGEAIAPRLEHIVREARLVLTRHEEQFNEEIEKIILTGGGSVLNGILEYAGAAFNKETIRANPFEKVGYPAFLEETLSEAGPSFSVSLGVALRLLNEQ